MKIIAHRGASQEAPENTLSAFERALELGADWIELDVHMTHDGIPVVIHDSTIAWEEDPSERYAIQSLTLEELQEFDLENGEIVPTLESVLELNIPAMIEIKWMGKPYIPYIESILPYLKGKDCVVGSLNPKIVAYLKTHHSRTVGIVKTPSDLEPFIQLHPPILALHHSLINKNLIQKLHTLNIEVWGWTIDDLMQARDFEAMGLDGVITNHVREFLQISKDKPKKNN